MAAIRSIQRPIDKMYEPGSWFSFFFQKTTRITDENTRQTSYFNRVEQYYSMNWPYLTKEQIRGKVFDYLSIPHYCGKIDRVKLRKLVDDMKLKKREKLKVVFSSSGGKQLSKTEPPSGRSSFFRMSGRRTLSRTFRDVPPTRKKKGLIKRRVQWDLCEDDSCDSIRNMEVSNSSPLNEVARNDLPAPSTQQSMEVESVGDSDNDRDTGIISPEQFSSVDNSCDGEGNDGLSRVRSNQWSMEVDSCGISDCDSGGHKRVVTPKPAEPENSMDVDCGNERLVAPFQLVPPFERRGGSTDEIDHLGVALPDHEADISVSSVHMAESYCPSQVTKGIQSRKWEVGTQTTSADDSLVVAPPTAIQSIELDCEDQENRVTTPNLSSMDAISISDDSQSDVMGDSAMQEALGSVKEWAKLKDTALPQLTNTSTTAQKRQRSEGVAEYGSTTDELPTASVSQLLSDQLNRPRMSYVRSNIIHKPPACEV